MTEPPGPSPEDVVELVKPGCFIRPHSIRLAYQKKFGGDYDAATKAINDVTNAHFYDPTAPLLVYCIASDAYVRPI